MWRCRNTVLPYMKEIGVKGEVWPELCEQPTSVRILEKDLPKSVMPVLGAPDRFAAAARLIIQGVLYRIQSCFWGDKSILIAGQ